MVNPVTQKYVDETCKLVRNVEAANKKIQASYKKATSDLTGAIKDKNESMIALYRPPLDAVEKEIADCIRDVELAISRVKGLQEDEAFMKKRFDLVEKLLGSVSKMRTQLTTQLVDSKKLAQQAVDSLGKLENDTEDAASEFASVEDATNDLEAQMEKVRPQVTKHAEAAEKALMYGNKAAHDEAQKKLLELKIGDLIGFAVGYKADVEKFQKKYPESALKTEATWLRDRLEKLHGDLDALKAKVVRVLQDNRALGADKGGGAAPDVAKAAKVLGVGSSDQPKLAKVLAGRPNTYEKGLAELADDLELEERNGRKLVAKLEKAKVLVA